MARLTKRLDDGQAVMDCKNCELNSSQKCTALSCRNRLKDRLAEYEEVEPVKHGRWEDFSSIWECDQCHKWFSLEQGTADMNYCPHCGAKMDGGTPMPDCKWMKDEICVNADCPMRADYCPVANDPGVCRFEEREDGGAEE